MEQSGPSKQTLKRKERQQKRREQGLCFQCGREREDKSKSRCELCLTKHRESNKLYGNKVRCEKCQIMNKYQPGSTICQSCGHVTANPNLTRYIERKTNHHCTICGSKDILPNREESDPRCETCWLKYRASAALGSAAAWTILKEKLDEQQYLCPYTGDKLELGVNTHLDHIHPVSRFPELRNNIDNVEWVSGRVNFMKRDLTKDEFLTLVRNIAIYTEETYYGTN